MKYFQFCFSLVILGFFLAATVASGAGWEEHKISGRSYISIPSLAEYYQMRSSKSGKKVILESPKILMNLVTDTTACDMNGVKFVLSYPVLTHDGKSWISRIDLSKLVDPVLRPNFIKGAENFNTVIIDAGHGGKDQGARGVLNMEAQYNLAIAKMLQEILTKQRYRVIMTRSSDIFLSLQQRANIANKITDNAIFISIHQNSSSNRSARGIETFTLSPVGVTHYGRSLRASDFRASLGNSHDSASVALATAIHGTLLTTLIDPKSKQPYTLDRGIKRARFNVLSNVTHPSVLIECGFVTNPRECRYLDHKGYQKAIAQAIASAISRYRHAISGAKASATSTTSGFRRGPTIAQPPATATQ